MTVTVAAPQELQPQVTEIAASDDRDWFAAHPNRQFCARRDGRDWWLIRRAGKDVLLRTFARSQRRTPPDTDQELAAMWVAAAYPEATPQQIKKAVKRVLKRGAKR
jgi:hypothetical protein